MTEIPLPLEVIDRRYQLLSECHAFSGLHQTDLLIVASLPEIHSLHYQPGARVFRIAEEPLFWFVVEQGSIEGSLIDPQTFKKVTHTFNKGAFLTEQAIVNCGDPYTFTATVTSPEGADLLIIPPEPLNKQFSQGTRISLSILMMYHQILTQTAEDKASVSMAKNGLLAFIREYSHVPEPQARIMQMLLEAIEEAGLKIEREVKDDQLIALHLKHLPLDFLSESS